MTINYLTFKLENSHHDEQLKNNILRQDTLPGRLWSNTCPREPRRSPHIAPPLAVTYNIITGDIGYCDYHLVTNIGYCDYVANPRFIPNATLVLQNCRIVTVIAL